MTEKILVVVAHPDDETLGCGGSIARWVSEGHTVGVWFGTDGVAARGHHPNAAHDRRCAARDAMQVLGVSYTLFADFPDNQLDSISRLEITKSIETCVGTFSPTRIVTHSQADLNVDHRLVGECAAVATRPLPGSRIREVWHMEVLSSTSWYPDSRRSFSPTVFVDIKDFLERKTEALRSYGSEIPPWPGARSSRAVEALAALRGSEVGTEAAEGFELSRLVIR